MRTESIAGPLRTLWTSGAVGLLGDPELLDRFVRRRDEAAFEALVDRHGAMVLRTCLAVLNDPHEAQDCSQAAFLVLARRAHAIRRGESVGSWLFGVARRVSLRARGDARRRGLLVVKLAELASQSAPPPGESWADLHAEIDRLPEAERAAILACDLEGLSHEAAAHRLGWTTRSVGKRLYRGRERLRSRLVRKGLTFAPAVLGPMVLSPSSARAMAEIARGAPASAKVVSLVRGVSRAMLIPSWKIFAASLLAGGAVLVGGLMAFSAQDAPKPKPEAKASPKSSVSMRSGPTDAEAANLLRRAADTAIASGLNGYGPGSLGEIASALAAAGDVEGAKETFRRSVEAALAAKTPIAWVLTRIAREQIAAGMKTEAAATLAHAVEVAERQPDPGQNQTYFLAMIIANQARAGDSKGAKATLSLVKAAVKARPNGLDGYDVVTLAGAKTAAGEEDDAFRDVARVWAAGGPGATYLASQALGAMAESAQELDPKAARPIVERIATLMEGMELDPNAQVHALSNLAQALAYVGDAPAARAMILRIGREGERGGPTDVTDTQPYALMVVALIEQERGDLAGARESLRLARKTIADNPKMRGIEGRYEQVAHGDILVGDLDFARSALPKINPGRRHETLSRIAFIEQLRGDPVAAKKDLRLAIEDAKLRADEPPKPIAANAPVAVAVGADGKVVPTPTSEVIAAQNRAWALADVASLQAQAGEHDAARQTLTMIAVMKDLPNRESVLTNAHIKIAQARAGSGDLAGAIAAAVKVEPDAARASALGGAAEGYRAWKRPGKRR